jgi:Tfp pilus assembly protein PilZ
MEEKQSFLEKRSQFRVSVKIPVQYQLVEDPRELDLFHSRTALAKDLSLDGMYIKTDTTVKVGDVFRLDISLPQDSKRLFAFAEVAWIHEGGAGLKLMLMATEDATSLKKYLDQTVS